MRPHLRFPTGNITSQQCHSRLETSKCLFQDVRVLDLAAFENLGLRGGFVIVEIRLTSQFLLDPLGRPATAQTVIRGYRFHISLRQALSEAQLSISLYHEVLEAATVAAEHPPQSVTKCWQNMDFSTKIWL